MNYVFSLKNCKEYYAVIYRMNSDNFKFLFKNGESIKKQPGRFTR